MVVLLFFFSKRIGKSLGQVVFLPTLNSRTIGCDNLSNSLAMKTQALVASHFYPDLKAAVNLFHSENY